MCIRSRAVSIALSASEKSGTAAWPLRSSGTVATPLRRRSLAESPPSALPSTRTASGSSASTSPESASSRLFWPFPATPAMPKISPARTEKPTSRSGIPKCPAAGTDSPLHHEPLLAEVAARLALDVLEAAADHLLGHRARGLGPGVAGVDQPAAAQDGRGVAERLYLVELVRDVEDRAAFRSHAAQHDEELLDLLRRQDRGRLVHDQQVRLEKQRADDLDALALADRQRRRRSAAARASARSASSPR